MELKLRKLLQGQAEPARGSADLDFSGRDF